LKDAPAPKKKRRPAKAPGKKKKSKRKGAGLIVGKGRAVLRGVGKQPERKNTVRIQPRG